MKTKWKWLVSVLALAAVMSPLASSVASATPAAPTVPAASTTHASSNLANSSFACEASLDPPVQLRESGVKYINVTEYAKCVGEPQSLKTCGEIEHVSGWSGNTPIWTVDAGSYSCAGGVQSVVGVGESFHGIWHRCVANPNKAWDYRGIAWTQYYDIWTGLWVYFTPIQPSPAAPWFASVTEEFVC